MTRAPWVRRAGIASPAIRLYADFCHLTGGRPFVHDQPGLFDLNDAVARRIVSGPVYKLVGAGLVPFRATVVEVDVTDIVRTHLTPHQRSALAGDGAIKGLHHDLTAWILLGHARHLADGGARVIDATATLCEDPLRQGELRHLCIAPQTDRRDLRGWRARLVELGVVLAETDLTAQQDPTDPRLLRPVTPESRAAWLDRPRVGYGLVRGLQRLRDALAHPEPGDEAFWGVDLDRADWNQPAAARALASECLARMRAGQGEKSAHPAFEALDRTVFEPRAVPNEIRSYVITEIEAYRAAARA